MRIKGIELTRHQEWVMNIIGGIRNKYVVNTLMIALVPVLAYKVLRVLYRTTDMPLVPAEKGDYIGMPFYKSRPSGKPMATYNKELEP